jgi:membrane-bound ClpP family serine protease
MEHMLVFPVPSQEASRPLKLVLRCTVAVFTLFVLVGLAAHAAPPILTPIDPGGFTQETHPGETRSFDVTYTDAQGDAPKTLDLVLETPGGQVTEHAAIPPGDPTQGIPVTWTYTPENSGAYRFHFEAVSTTGQSVRFPASPTNDYEFASVNPWTKIGIFIAGLIVAFLILPFVVYVAARSVNRQGDPAAAARIGLFLGVLASLGLYLYLFAADYGVLGIALASVAAVAILIVLFSRRRAI